MQASIFRMWQVGIKHINFPIKRKTIFYLRIFSSKLNFSKSNKKWGIAVSEAFFSDFTNILMLKQQSLKQQFVALNYCL